MRALTPGERPLPGTADPIHYALTLWLDPSAPTFRGALDLRVRLHRPTPALQLHAADLRIERASVRAAGGRAPLTARLEAGGALFLEAAAPMPVGEVTVHLEWTALIRSHPEGLYRVVVAGRPYLFTHLQPVGARRVFPCFDEPRHKASFAVRVHAPSDLVVAGNTALLDERDPAGGRSFATTPPLPTYLVALVVGPFDVVVGDGLRVLTPHGAGHQAAFALALAPRLLGALTEWCGRACPYRKLDLVAVPGFPPGGMENVGLIHVRARLLLADPSRDPARARWTVVVLAHELAHMWFGNLVTPDGWDGLWLCESLATLFEGVVADLVAPAWGVGLDAGRARLEALAWDAHAEVRPVRMPVQGFEDVAAAFDPVVPRKGAALLAMARGWIGEARFRDGVRRWLARNAHGVAAAPALFSSLDERGEPPVATLLAGFLDQSGAPQIDLRPTADPRAFTIRQRRAAPGGQRRPGARWQVPIELRYGDDRGTHRLRLLLTETKTTVRLAVAPRWMHPNHEEHGYYRWSLPPALLAALRTAPLTVAERVALPAHLLAGLEADEVPAAAAIWGALDGLRSTRRAVVEAALDAAAGLRRLTPDQAVSALAGRVRSALEPHRRRLGLRARAGEPPGDALLRGAVLRSLAGLGQDEALRVSLCAEADVTLYSDRPAPDRASLAWPVAGALAGPRRFALMSAALGRLQGPGLRATLVHALGCVEDPALLAEALALYRTALLRPEELLGLLRPMVEHPAGADAVLRWLEAGFDGITAKAGPRLSARLASLAAGARGPAARSRWGALFADPARRPPGAESRLRRALDASDRMDRARARAGPALAAALRVG